MIKPIIEPITYDSIKNLNEIKNKNIKEIDIIDIYVKKYYDYFEKYGIGYILNNGFIGVFYRDRTKMILNTKKNKYKYIEKNREVTNKFRKNNCPENLINKMNILNEFKKSLIKSIENEKEIKISDKEETKINEEINEEEEDNDEIDFIYVENVIFDKYFIFFKLSNQTQHFFFDDKVQMIMSCKVLTYKYINDKKEEQITNFYLKDVLNNPIKELIKRYNYARYSYFKWIDKRIKKNIEKNKKEENEKGKNEEKKKDIENDNNNSDKKIYEYK